MANCFDEIENEDLDSCLNSELAAGVSEVGVFYVPHVHALVIPQPPNVGDVDADYEGVVTIEDDITFAVGKGFGKILIQANTGEVKSSLVGDPGNKKHKEDFDFYVPSNSKKLLGFVRTMKNVPSIYLVTDRSGQKRMIGDANNPAYMTEVAGTTGKGGEDNVGFQFTISAYSIPTVYEGVVTLNTPPAP